MLPTFPVHVVKGSQMWVAVPQPPLFYIPPTPPPPHAFWRLSAGTGGGSQDGALTKTALTDHCGPVSLTRKVQSPQPGSHLYHLLDVFHHERLIQLGFGSGGPLIQH